MKRVSKFSLLALFLAVATSRGQDKLAETSEFYPLQLGTTWIYKVDGKTTVEVKVAKYDKQGEQIVALLETRADDNLVSRESVAVAKLNEVQGVYRFAFQGSVADPALCFLKLPPKKDDKWEFKSKIGGKEVSGSFKVGEEKGIKVPAGTFDTFTVTCEDLKVENEKVAVKYFFATGKGMVKQEVKVAGITMTLELEKFEEGKK